MKITNIHVKNFKSFKDENIEINDLMILIGPNASGKSNTISLIKFLSNIINYGIDDAISLMGGIEYIKNASSSNEENIYLKYDLDFSGDNFNLSNGKNSKNFISLKDIIVEFEIAVSKRGGSYSLSKNNLIVNYEGCMEKNGENIVYGKYELILSQNKTNCIVTSQPLSTGEVEQKKYSEDVNFLEWLKNFLLKRVRQSKKELYVTKIDFFMPGFFDIDNCIKVYDFDIKKMKNSASILTSKKLDEEGTNVANVLQTILKSKEKKRKFLNILSDILPFVEQIEIEKNYDKSISYLIKEKYSNKKYYSNFLSDGTVNIIAIVIALYFGDNDEFVVLEEPERNLHPQMLSKIVNMAKDVSKDKQIVITTHNPELIRNADINNIVFTKRNSDGHTCLQNVSEDVNIKEFLENDLGIDELFVNGFLGK